MKQNPSREANNFIASQEISAVYGTGSYIIMVTRAHWLFPFWGRWIHSMSSHCISLCYILIFSFHCLGRLSCRFLPVFTIETVYSFLPRPNACHTTAHFIILYFITWIIFGERYRYNLWCLQLFVQVTWGNVVCVVDIQKLSIWNLKSKQCYWNPSLPCCVQLFLDRYV